MRKSLLFKVLGTKKNTYVFFESERAGALEVWETSV